MAKTMKKNIKENNKEAMRKTLEGTVVSTKMNKTVTVVVTRKIPHPLYKKLIKRDKKFAADTGTFNPVVGDRVRIVSAKPVSKTKKFKILEVIKNGSK